ncbi:MAG: SAM-dependent chlorinase/fluorinase [Candidatus Omnitrophica bacterium]|nr:SAM-dependent chlorinase/fluorinase [Candidatus Omnitrophota bacterium]
MKKIKFSNGVNLIALLTDFGNRDGFAASVKAVILSKNPDAKLIDISHDVSSYNIQEAAFILFSCFSYFPQKTVFMAVVDPGVGSKRLPIAIKTRNYFFIGPDNGILSLAAKSDGIEKIVFLGNKKYFLKDIPTTFHGRDIFASAAAYLSKGFSVNKLGCALKKIEETDLELPEIKKNEIKGAIIYTDKFGNLITNITGEQFQYFLKHNDNFSCILNKKKINKTYSFYNQAKDNEPFLIEGSLKFMEISVKNKSAKEFFKIRGTGGKVIVKN